METIDYIDWDEGREFADASDSFAVNTCQGCNHTCERLHVEPLEQLLFCDTCMDETMRELARQEAA